MNPETENCGAGNQEIAFATEPAALTAFPSIAYPKPYIFT